MQTTQYVVEVDGRRQATAWEKYIDAIERCEAERRGFINRGVSTAAALLRVRVIKIVGCGAGGGGEPAEVPS